MSWFRPSTLLDKAFEGSVIIKGLTGAVEALTGLALVFIDPVNIHRYIDWLAQNELLEERHDRLATFLIHSTQHISLGSRWFAVAYLWIHALIKLIAVVGLLRNLRWAYPFSLLTLGGLLIYQVFSIITMPSVGMFLLSVFDVCVLWLIYREYIKVRKESGPVKE